MEEDSVRGIGGWLLVYVVGSIPLLWVYSMGLSGWFFEYPVLLMAAIFLALAVPLLGLLLKSPNAPRWNIAMLWTAAVLMTLRALNVFILPIGTEGQPPLRGEELVAVIQTLSGIVSVSLGWTVVWTRYFRHSVRVKNTFSGAPRICR